MIINKRYLILHALNNVNIRPIFNRQVIKTIVGIIGINCCTIATPLFADDISIKDFYIEFSSIQGPENLSPSNDYAGASGYVCADCPTGLIGEVENDPKNTQALKLGYTFSENLSSELSFYNVNFGTTTWDTDFNSFDGTYNSSVATSFSGKLTSTAMLLGVNYNLKPIGKLKPFLGVGAGPSFNEFHAAKEGTYATVNKNTNRSIAYKADLGALYDITSSIAINAGVSFLNLGDFESAKTRDTGSTQAISPYKFSSGWNKSISLGLRYSF